MHTFPSWKNLREYQLSKTPEIENIDPIENFGIKTTYKHTLTMTIQHTLISLENLPPSQKCIFHFKDGVDGNG